MGFRQFCEFLKVCQVTVHNISLPRLSHIVCCFAAYLFFFRGLQPSSIRSYISGVNHQLNLANIIPGSIWTSILNQVMRGIDRQTSIETPLINRAKLPFSLPLILLARSETLGNCLNFELHAIFAALCLGFMFLLRKSEFLTNGKGYAKTSQGVQSTLLAENVHLWWGENVFVATSTYFPMLPPDFISVYLPRSKGDPLGKGATRFFPRQSGVQFCLVSAVYTYVRDARLRTGDCFFAGPRFMVSSDMVAKAMKDTSARAGLPPDRVGLHSLRIGGLVSLFAANAPSHLLVLAGRWASESSFVQYMRATMEQYNTIAAALNSVDLVNARHIRQLYTVPSNSTVDTQTST